MDKEQRDTNSTFTNHRSTLNCILCGGKQIYPGPRYKNHLMNEHGVLLDLTFLLQISIFKRDKGALPDLSPHLDPLPLEDEKNKSCKVISTQTESPIKLSCVKCSDPVQESSEEEEENEDEGRKDDGLISCWFCSNCPKVFRKSAHLREHAIEVHKSDKELDALPKRMTEEEYYQHRHGIPVVYYSCYFCKELFRGDHRLKKHLHTEHKNESFAEMIKAKEELRKVRDARKKSVKCSLCGSGCITEPEFEKHLLSVHNLTKTQYQEEFGKFSSDVTLKRFKCELCDEEIEHVRETIALHMKNSHLISWTEYQEILLKIRREDGTETSVEPFDCQVCGERRINNKKYHLRKKHQMSDEVYDKLLGHRQSTPSTTKICKLCEHETQDLRRHVERIHRVSYESYIELTSESKEEESAMTNGGSNNHSLRCRYGCEDVFNKEYQLYLHLRLKHDSYEGDEEGSESSKRVLEEKCYLCSMKFFDVASLMSHIASVHDGPSKDNMSTPSGPTSNDSLSTPKNISPSNNNSIGGSFECKLCNRNFKYDRTAINEHLQAAHGINWLGYLDRIRVKADCKICDTSVKNLKEHLMTVHKLTEKEYEAKESDKSFNQSALSIDQSVSQSADDFLAVETNIPKPPKSDIQNKTNKTCSSCTITFASRRNFIEHCTTVHNMKFKTKSGLTIQAPKSNNSSAPVVNRKPVTSVAHQLTPSVTIKRKFDSNSNTNFSPPNFASNPSLLKRPRVEGGGNDLSSILPQLPQHPLPPAAIIEPVEKTLGSHYQTTGVSRWNQCKYQCCFCKKTTQSRSSMTSHIANTHGIPIKEYKERNYPDIEVVTNWFQCRLCSTKTKFVKDCISPHLKMSHSIDIEDYERQYMRPEDWPNCQKPAGGTKSEMRNSEVPTNRSLLKPAVPSSPSHPSDEENEKRKWNKCRFQCKICQLITIDARQMRVHISNAHKLSYDNYVAQYGSSEIVTKKFRCELCSSEMKFCRQDIYAHMKDVHKITLSEYEGKVGYVPPPDDDDIDESPEHIVINSDIATTKPYDCDVNDDSTHSQGPPPQQDHFTSKWNKCRYKCQICQRVTSEKPVIRDHILKQHGFDLEDYEAQYGDVEVVTEYFTCSICSAEVKHCHRNISLHLQKVHNMTTSEYDEAMSQNESPSLSKDNGEIGGFGAHFLLDSNSSDSSSPTRRPASNGPPIRPPPREDIINPKNKYCMPCNRDFNRRQAFVEHCRNVHRMTINFTRDTTRADSEEGQVQTVHPSVVTVTTTPGSLNCDYCGKQFSNRSNRNRHMLLSCEVVKAGGMPRTPHQQMIAEGGGSIKCPMSDCDSYFNVGSSLSGHLADAHGIMDKSEDDEERLTASPIKTKDHEHHNRVSKSGDEATEEVKVEFQEDGEGEVDYMDTSGEITRDDDAPSPVPSVKNLKEEEEDDDDSDDDSDSESDDDSDDSDSDSDSDDDDEQKTRESDN